MNAVVLAGGAPDGVSRLQPDAANKAFVTIGGITLVARTIAALRAAPEVERIIVVAPAATHGDPALAAADECRVDGPRMIESLASGLRDASPDALVLVCASDLPVLSAASIGEFIGAARARDLDIAYSIVAQRVHLARYPRIPHTWAAMRDGRYCGGGVVALRPRVLPALRTLLDDFGAARKSPLRLAALFGWDVLVRFACGRLTIAAAEARATRLAGAPVGAIACSYPEIAVNVDRPADVARAHELIA